MKRFLPIIALIIVACLPFLAQAESVKPGFGQQPGIIQPVGDPRSLLKRILGSTSYKLTPGDAYELIISIEETERYPLLLSDDYKLDIPFIGTLNVEGMYFSELKNTIISRIKARVPVLFVDFVLQSPALFDVFIHGGVKAPGIATVNPLSRVSDAVALAQGFVKGASFRRVELLRDDSKEILDLSRFAAEADFTQNPLLEPGDRIYIPQADRIVELEGKILYPGIYELLAHETLKDLLNYAGGITPDAQARKIQIARLGQGGKSSLVSIDLNEQSDYQLKNGDKIIVDSMLKNREMITVEGAFFGTPTSGDKPAMIPTSRIIVNLPYIPGMTVLQVMDSLGGPTPLAETAKAYLQKSESGEKVFFDAEKLWQGREPSLDLTIEADDFLLVPMKKLQIFVAGEVNNPGAFPYANGLKVFDYIIAAGGISIETGDRNKIYFVDELGNRKRIGMENDVEPGNLIYIGKNSWTVTQKVLTDVLVITGFTAALLALANGVIDLIQEF